MLRLTRRLVIGGMLALAIGARLQPVYAAGLEETFSRHTAASPATVDHADWTRMLQVHVEDGKGGLNRVKYAAWKGGAHADLKAYVARLEKVDVAGLGRPEQFAFWANLYNAKTIDIVLDRYPVRSIKDISLGGTLLANVTGGPWKAKVTTVAGQALSLDDIEHVILRGIFKDARVHYAVNCASIGCPNLRREAYTGAALEAQLDAAARDYVNSPRGVSISGTTITASSIYDWFRADFGKDNANILLHLRRYAEPPLAASLARATSIDRFDYDWKLNDAGS
jgi:Protein of unknown function, DUF547